MIAKMPQHCHCRVTRARLVYLHARPNSTPCNKETHSDQCPSLAVPTPCSLTGICRCLASSTTNGAQLEAAARPVTRSDRPCTPGKPPAVVTQCGSTLTAFMQQQAALMQQQINCCEASVNMSSCHLTQILQKHELTISECMREMSIHQSIKQYSTEQVALHLLAALACYH